MIRMEQVCFSYGDKKILQRFNLIVHRGERICLMAPSGMGKTTVLRLCTGHLHPDEGKIIVADGIRMSMVFQEDRLCENYTAGENIMLGCMREMQDERKDGRSAQGDISPQTGEGIQKLRAYRRERIVAHLACVGLADSMDTPISALSGGMKRRVSIVRAVLSASDLVIMDEPFAGIDQDNIADAVRYIDGHLQGRALLMVSHDEQEAAALSARIVRL